VLLHELLVFARDLLLQVLDVPIHPLEPCERTHMCWVHDAEVQHDAGVPRIVLSPLTRSQRAAERRAEGRREYFSFISPISAWDWIRFLE
jgi:hypothetical protein